MNQYSFLPISEFLFNENFQQNTSIITHILYVRKPKLTIYIQFSLYQPLAIVYKNMAKIQAFCWNLLSKTIFEIRRSV